MTAHCSAIFASATRVCVEDDAALTASIESCISALLDARSRARIVGAYCDGRITASDALDILLALDLIEAPAPPADAEGAA